MSVRIDPDSFGFLVNDVARLMRGEMERLVAEAGLALTPGEARALVNAARAGAVRQTVLAERMGVEAMTMCGYVDRLEAQGLVRRSVDPQDRRAKLVHLTDAADEMLVALGEVGAEVHRLASTDLSAQEWSALNALLKRVRETLSPGRGETVRKGSAA